MGSFETFDVAVRRRRHGPIVAAIDLLAGLRRVERVAHVRANERGVFLDGEHVIAADAVRHAYVVPRKGARPVVVFETATQTVELFVQDVARGTAMLDATMPVVEGSMARFERVQIADGTRGKLRVAVAFLMLLAGVTVLLGVGGPASLLLAVVVGVAVIFIVHETRDAQVTVGADGVAYRNGARERFFPHGAFSIEPDDAALATTATICIGARTIVFHFDGPAPRRTFLRRVATERARATRASSAHDAASRLTRGARDDGEWVRDLRTLADGDYRSTTIPLEDLWHVVEDPSAPSSARAGAALGLHATLDDRGRARLRVVAEACASPRLRVALDAAATIDNDDAIERAAGECAAEEAQRG